MHVKWSLSLWITVAFVAGLACGLALYPWFHPWSVRWQADRAQRKYLNRPAPDVTTTTIDGSRWSMEDQRGKVVLLEFWAPWCGPCAEAVPILKRAQQQYGGRDDFAIVTVALDESREAVLDHIRDAEWPWLVLHEPGRGWSNSVARAFGIRWIPTFLVIDRERQIVAVCVWGEQVDHALLSLMPSPNVDSDGGTSRTSSSDRVDPGSPASPSSEEVRVDE